MAAGDKLDRASPDPGAVFTHLAEWLAPYRADPTPAAVADVLAGFTFLVGVNLATTDPVVARALLKWLQTNLPSADESARTLADEIRAELLGGVGQGWCRKTPTSRRADRIV